MNIIVDESSNKVFCNDGNNNLLASAIITQSSCYPLKDYFNSLVQKEIAYIKEEYNLSDDDHDEILECDEGNLAYLTYIRDKAEKMELSLNNGVFIELIESEKGGTGAGTHIVNYLKEKYDFIILYSALDSESYWEKVGFSTFYCEYYSFDKKQLLSFLKDEI